LTEVFHVAPHLDCTSLAFSLTILTFSFPKLSVTREERLESVFSFKFGFIRISVIIPLVALSSYQSLIFHLTSYPLIRISLFDTDRLYIPQRPCARSFMETFFQGAHPLALCLEVFGSYGNQIISFIHAIFCTKIANIAEIFCCCGWAHLPPGEHFVTPDGISITTISKTRNVPYPRKYVLFDSFFFASDPCPDFSWKHAITGITHHLRKPFPPLNLDPELLVIVLRGGIDMWIWKDWSRTYTQPPCNFFLNVMKNFSKTLVVGGDHSACLDKIIKAGATSIPWNDIQATRYMLYARNVVWSRTSRAHGGIALAAYPQRFWMFDTEWDKQQNAIWWIGFQPEEFGEAHECVPSETYREELTPWLASEKQIQLIMEGNCPFRKIGRTDYNHI
jgi:hypothetical protein